MSLTDTIPTSPSGSDIRGQQNIKEREIFVIKGGQPNSSNKINKYSYEYHK